MLQCQMLIKTRHKKNMNLVRNHLKRSINKKNLRKSLKQREKKRKSILWYLTFKTLLAVSLQEVI